MIKLAGVMKHMNIDLFFDDQINKLKTLTLENETKFLEYGLYDENMDKRILYIFVVLHHEINELFDFMNEKI
jgi:hypothetical protein